MIAYRLTKTASWTPSLFIMLVRCLSSVLVLIRSTVSAHRQPHPPSRYAAGPLRDRGALERFIVGLVGRTPFTLVEVMVVATMTAILLVCTLFGIVSLQYGYTSTEEYGAGQADQSRLLDLLALDLRRGIQLSGSTTCYAMDPDGQGLKITVPDLYSFSPSDPQHLSSLLVTPTYDATTQTAFYNGSGTQVAPGGPYPSQVIDYRFNSANGSITRSDPWAPLVASGKAGYTAAAPVVIANNMEAFPAITPDPADISGNTVHYSVSFRSTFQTLSTTSTGTSITLSNVTFIRSKNLAH